MVGNWSKIKIFGTFCPPFVVPFRFTQGNRKTNGGQLAETLGFRQCLPIICCSISFYITNWNNKWWAIGRKLGFLAPFARQLLFHFVLQNEMEQHMVDNWSKMKISGTVRPPFVVPFRFTERNGTTNGGQLVENSYFRQRLPTVWCSISFYKRKWNNKWWAIGRKLEFPAPSAHHLLFHLVLQNEMEQQMVGNWSNIEIFGAICPAFVPFRFTERYGTTSGGQLVES